MSRKYIDFEAVEELATIEQLAEMLGLDTKRTAKQLRCACPIHGGDERTLAISPDVRSRRGKLGVFFCQQAKSGGDSIALVAHCMDIGQQDAAFFIAEQFGTEGTGTVTSTSDSNSTVSKSRATVPQKNEGRANVPAFDPSAFAKRLSYSQEVKELGLSEEDAMALGIGFHAGRKAVYLPIRNADGSISGFIGFANGELKMPPRWIFPSSNVVALPKRA